MRVGIFGGTFDPIHYGHLILAEQCREQCELDEVWFVPAAQPPHKLTVHRSPPAKSRCEMVDFATSPGTPAFRLKYHWNSNADGIPSFTVMTLEQLQVRRRFARIVSADRRGFVSRFTFIGRQPDRILELATVVAVNRGDRPLPDRAQFRAMCGDFADTRIVGANMPAIDHFGQRHSSASLPKDAAFPVSRSAEPCEVVSFSTVCIVQVLDVSVAATETAAEFCAISQLATAQNSIHDKGPPHQ